MTYPLCVNVFQLLFPIFNNLSSAKNICMFFLGRLSVKLNNSQLTLVTCRLQQSQQFTAQTDYNTFYETGTSDYHYTSTHCTYFSHRVSTNLTEQISRRFPGDSSRDFKKIPGHVCIASACYAM